LRSPPTVLLVGGGAAYALVAASTTPFTLPADVLTGLAIVGMAVLVIVRWPFHTRAARTAEPVEPVAADGADEADAADGADAGKSASKAPRSHRYLPWVLVIVVFTAWELFNYVVHGSRADHPTFSSITDANDRFYLLKALLFLGWMAAALVIVRRGRPQRAARPARVRS
jgi:hypothetical protein